MDKTLATRGYLLHITHYDPVWCAKKEHEEPFDRETAFALIDAMAAAGLNLLVIDTKDGLEYASHPELRRPYTQPMSLLTDLAAHARSLGLEVALKLNFSQSDTHRHNHWFRPHNQLFDSDEYWRRAFQIIDELIAAARPERFFHIGMDEDHWRSHRQYVAAIGTLRNGLADRGLRTLIWNDSACQWPAAEHHKEKSLLAEKAGPRDVTHVLWDYGNWDPARPGLIRGAGLDVWGAPGSEPALVAEMRDRIRRVGGTGLLLTRWAPCVPANRESLLQHLRTCGPLCAG